MAIIEGILIELSASVSAIEQFSNPPEWLLTIMFFVFKGLIALPSFIAGTITYKNSPLIGGSIGILGGCLFITAYYIPMGNDLLMANATKGLLIAAAVCSAAAYTGKLLQKYMPYYKLSSLNDANNAPPS